jgi:lipopolysaccharide/colanic/teichoic acid biosynthesis glycosyltransferase
MRYNPTGKRLIDLAAAFIACATLLPFMLIVAVVVRITSEGPVLFRQVRVGLGGTPFTMLKFRTMVVNAPDIRNPDGSTFNSHNDPRLTPPGALLRKTSVDELPQLWNVLLGDMSLVGGRPDLPDALSNYAGTQGDRLLVKPGLTSWAIVNGRNNVPVETRRELDAWYARNVSLALDAKIVLATVVLVLGRKGVINEHSTKDSWSKVRNSLSPITTDNEGHG